MKESYADILYLRRPVSHRRAHMPPEDRAAQFSPFAALTGYEDTIAETGRVTDSRCELAEDARLFLNAQLQDLQKRIHAHPCITVTRFQPDPNKDGGAYIRFTGQLKRIDTRENQLLFTDGTSIPLEDILAISP